MFYPLFTFTMLIFLFLFSQMVVRIFSVVSGKVSIKHFRYVNGSDVPSYILAGTKQFSNLFETPILFYVVGVLAITLKIESALLINLSWAYVVARVVHCFIHIAYNNIIHRMIAFQVSVVLLVVMWLVMFSHYSAL